MRKAVEARAPGRRAPPPPPPRRAPPPRPARASASRREVPPAAKLTQTAHANRVVDGKSLGTGAASCEAWNMRRALLLVALAAACGGTSLPPPPPPRSPLPARSARPSPAPPSARAPFVVAVVVDQLASWSASAKLPRLPAEGGFARLTREGTWVRHMRYPYAVTATAPGHAALSTGKVPAESGVFANEILDANARAVSIMQDDAARLVGPGGPREEPGASARILGADTLADRLRVANPDALVVSISGKDRGAILPAGKRPSHVLWYDKAVDAFVTSTAFTRTYPPWASDLGSTEALVSLRSAPWEPTDVAWLEAHAHSSDRERGEGNLDGMGISFPHDVKTPAAFRTSPASDQAIVRLALAAVEAEHDPARPTLLLLSLSANDLIGHTFGPDSWEAWDELHKIDALLGDLLERLEARVGPVRLVLSADHGVTTLPEAAAARGKRCAGGATSGPLELPCAGGTRVDPQGLARALGAAAAKALGPGTWVRGLSEPYVYLSAEARALPDARRAILDAAIRGELAKRRTAIEAVYDARELASDCPSLLAKARGVPERALPGEDVKTLVCRSWPPGSSAGDYYVVLGRGAFFDPDVVRGTGVNHGTPWLYDRTVPLFVYAKGEIEGGAVIEEPVDFTAFAALGAAFLGLERAPAKEVLAARIAR
jgi:hypothetical protein